MTMRIDKYIMAVWLGLALLGCTREHSELGGDSSTHWLKSCAKDAQCGGLSCVCGVCSSECSAQSECGIYGASASCVTGAGQCATSARLCDHECRRDVDCGNSSLTCQEGRCRKRIEPVPVEVVDASPVLPPEEDGSVAPMSDAAVVVPAPDSAAPPGPVGQLDAGPSSTCAAQLAAATNDCLPTEMAFSWNGNACEELSCGCQGTDCGSTFRTRSACESRYAECISPTSVCSGLPWYQCGDHCPRDWNLAGGGRSFGECTGDCGFDLTLALPAPPSATSCAGAMSGRLLVRNTAGLPDRFVDFTLTPAGFEEVMRLSRALDGLMLDPVTECPDCALDSGQASIKQLVKGGTSTAEFAYYYQHAPLQVRAADALVQRLIDEANVCMGSALLSCVHATPGGTDQHAPACGFSLGGSSCECPVSLEQLRTIDGTECSASCDTCQVPASTCGASCVQPCAGGPRRWQVQCAE